MHQYIVYMKNSPTQTRDNAQPNISKAVAITIWCHVCVCVGVHHGCWWGEGGKLGSFPHHLCSKKIKIKKYILKIKSVKNNSSFLNTLRQPLKMKFKLPEHKA